MYDINNAAKKLGLNLMGVIALVEQGRLSCSKGYFNEADIEAYLSGNIQDVGTGAGDVSVIVVEEAAQPEAVQPAVQPAETLDELVEQPEYEHPPQRAAEREQLSQEELDERQQRLVDLVGSLGARRITDSNGQLLSAPYFDEYCGILEHVQQTLEDVYGTRVPRDKTPKENKSFYKLSGLRNFRQEVDALWKEKLDFVDCIGISENVSAHAAEMVSPDDLWDRVENIECIVGQSAACDIITANPKILYRRFKFDSYISLLDDTVDEIRRKGLTEEFDCSKDARFTTIDGLMEVRDHVLRYDHSSSGKGKGGGGDGGYGTGTDEDIDSDGASYSHVHASILNAVVESGGAISASGETGIAIAPSSAPSVQAPGPEKDYSPASVRQVREGGYDFEMVDFLINLFYRPSGGYRYIGRCIMRDEFLFKSVKREFGDSPEAKRSFKRTLHSLIGDGVLIRAGGKSSGDCYSLNPSIHEAPQCLQPYLKEVFTQNAN